MKSKLNLTIEKDLVPRFKCYARKRNKSVSQVVEEVLVLLTGADEPSFSDRWRGKFRLQRKTGPRFKLLKKRYNL